MERTPTSENAADCLPGLETVADQQGDRQPAVRAEATAAQCPPRLRRADRNQALLQPVWIDQLVSPDHPVRTFWLLTEKYCTRLYADAIKARGSRPGRASTDPVILLTLWIYGYSQAVGSAREIARLCECQDAYRWICGGVPINYHTLSDFRVEHREALENLFKQNLMMLVQRGLVDIQEVSQDGVRVRASAGGSSFRRGSTLKRLEQEAQAHLQALEVQGNDPSWTAREAAAQKRAARERLEHIQAALAQVPELQASKDTYANRQEHAEQKAQEPRASTTDAEARKMKMGDGGTRPAYNVQFVTAVKGRGIVAVGLNNVGSDRQQTLPLRREVEEQTGEKVKKQLVDGGFVRLEDIEKAGEEGVSIYAPRPQTQGVDPSQPKKGDGPFVAEWRQRMGEPEAQEIYKKRAATSETVNGDLKTWRGLDRFLVRGIEKAMCVTLMAALAYNTMHFGKALLG